MGRSRITRTFHNKPTSKARNIPNKNPNKSHSVSKTTKQVASSTQAKPKSKGLIPQAHAQESAYVKKPTKQVVSRRQVSTSVSQPKSTSTYGRQTTHILPENFRSSSGYVSQEKAEEQIEKEEWNNFEFRTTHMSKPHGRNITYRRTDRVESPSDTNFKPTTVTSKYTDLDTEKFTKERTILGKFAQGVGNEAQDIGGVPYGLVTGQDYKTKSILSRATEHAFRGDWDSAGKVISDNPYRFAGNVATNVGLSVIPFGIVARGAGLAGKAGKVVGKLKGKGTRKSYAGGRYTNKEINDAERLIQKAEWMPWGKSGKGGIKYPKTDNAGNKVSKKEWIRREKAADADLLRSDIRAGLRDSPGTVIPGRGVIGKDGINVIPFRKGIVEKAKSKVSKLRTSYRYANPDKKTFEGKVGRAKMLPQKIRDKKGDIDLKIKKKTYYKGFTQLHGRRRESINNPDYWGGPYSSRAGSLRAADRDIWEVNRFNKGSFRQQKPKSGVAFIPTTVPKHVGIGYDEYY